MNKKTKGILYFRSLFASVLVASLVLPSSGLALAAREKRESLPHVPGEIILKLKPGASLENQVSSKHRLGTLTQVVKNSSGKSKNGLDRIRLAKVSEQSLDAVLRELNNDPSVEYAEPNYIVTTSAIPNDPEFSKLWGMNNTGQTGGLANSDVDAPEAWEITTGTDLVVGVIDTGIKYNHPDLAANMWVNPGETAGNGIDDDGNGYIDDIHGWDFVAAGDNNPMDGHGHGTHVAGTIAGVGNNGIGVAGVNWTGKVAALKFLSDAGSGTTVDAIEAVNYANMMGFKITNNSWGGGGFSQALLDAILAGHAAGNLFVAAAGNSAVNNDLGAHFPSSYDAPNIIAVAATDHRDILAAFSNFGANSVDLAAPGVNIHSTVPTGTCSICDPTGYRTISGTSMATPHVAGAAALLWTHRPELTHGQVKNILMSTGTILSSLSGKTVSGKRLNLNNLFEEDSVPPAPVTDLAVQAKSIDSVTLRWTATGDDGTTGKASFNDLRYSLNPIDETNFESATRISAPLPTDPGTVQTSTIFGLNSATTYYFALKVYDNLSNPSGLSNVASETTNTPAVIYSDDMEGGVNWTVAGQSTPNGGPSLWHQSQRRSMSPSTSWYYGQESTGTYDTGTTNFGSITSPVIDLAGAQGAYLTFNQFLSTELSSQFDIAKVNVLIPEFNSVNTLAVYKDTNGVWAKDKISLASYQGFKVRIQFVFDTIDSQVNDFEGWYIDDVRIEAASAPEPAPNQPPVANAGPDKTAQEFEAVTFDGSASTDPDGTIASYDWTFGDGTSASGAVVSHAYAAAGSYVATLTVTDNLGKFSSDTVAVTVNEAPNQSPVANAGPDKTANTYQGVILDGSASTDPDGTISSYNWTFGDGTSLSSAVVSHTYVNPGTYVATLTVTDNDGATSVDTVNVTINPAPPVVVFTEGFETSSWTTNFTQDGQNDWGRNTGNSFSGSAAARYVGPGNNSQLISRNVSTAGRVKSSVYFSWQIAAAMDAGEYVAMDVSTDGGATWTEKARLRGNVDQEGSWLSRKIDLENASTVRVRFRGTSNESNERGFVDAVRIEAY